MHEVTSHGAPLSTRALDRLSPVADRVSALTRDSSRAVVDGDVALAEALLGADGERARCDTALQAAWSDILGGQKQPWQDVAANVSLLASLEKIADLSSSICRAVIGLASEARLRDLPSIRRLAELVPVMLRDALGAVRTNDHCSAERVLGAGFAVDTCFAQAHLDLLQVVPPGARDLHVARQFHTLGRALEQIGDSAAEIAASVRNPAVGLPV